MFDTLVDRQNRDVARAAQAAGIQDLLEVAQDDRRAVGLRDDAIDEIGSRQVQTGGGKTTTFVTQQGVGIFAQQFNGPALGGRHDWFSDCKEGNRQRANAGGGSE